MERWWCLPRSPLSFATPRSRVFLGLLDGCPQGPRRGWCWWDGCQLRRLVRKPALQKGPSLPVSSPLRSHRLGGSPRSALQVSESPETSSARGAPALSQAQQQSCHPQVPHAWRGHRPGTACRHGVNVGVSARHLLSLAAETASPGDCCGPTYTQWRHCGDLLALPCACEPLPAPPPKVICLPG